MGIHISKEAKVVDAIDLRAYFPDYAVIELRPYTGVEHTKYTFIKSPSGFQSLYDNYLSINKPGYHYSWQKQYKQGTTWCNPTYGILFMGDDKSVTEVGDWMAASGGCTPNVVFGYKTPSGVNTGLIWSPVGGSTTAPAIAEMDVWQQLSPGAAYAASGWKAFSKTGVVEYLATYAPPYGKDASGVWGPGNGKTYNDVVRIVMYHGTRSPTPSPIRCTGPVSASGPYYQSYKDYSSYAIEVYIAKGIGIIQEGMPFIEDGSYWGIPNCNGDIFSTQPSGWTRYIY